jgi:hypothetical protein
VAETPTTVELKTSAPGDGLKSASPAVAVPFSVADCGELEALSTTAMEPIRLPTAVGVNVTVTTQLALAASVIFAQVSVSVKSAPLLPETTTLVIVIELPDPLVSVSVCAAADAPRLVLAKVSEDALKLTEPAVAGVVPPLPQPIAREATKTENTNSAIRRIMSWDPLKGEL